MFIKSKKKFFLLEQFIGICSLMSENKNNIRRNAKYINKKVRFLKIVVLLNF